MVSGLLVMIKYPTIIKFWKILIASPNITKMYNCSPPSEQVLHNTNLWYVVNYPTNWHCQLLQIWIRRCYMLMTATTDGVHNLCVLSVNPKSTAVSSWLRPSVDLSWPRHYQTETIRCLSVREKFLLLSRSGVPYLSQKMFWVTEGSSPQNGGHNSY